MSRFDALVERSKKLHQKLSVKGKLNGLEVAELIAIDSKLAKNRGWRIPKGGKQLYAVRQKLNGRLLVHSWPWARFDGEIGKYTKGEALKKARMFEGVLVPLPAEYQDQKGRHVSDINLIKL